MQVLNITLQGQNVLLWEMKLCFHDSNYYDYSQLGFNVWHVGAQLAKSTVSHPTGSLPKFHVSVANCIKIMLNQG